MENWTFIFPVSSNHVISKSGISYRPVLFSKWKNTEMNERFTHERDVETDDFTVLSIITIL